MRTSIGALEVKPAPCSQQNDFLSAIRKMLRTLDPASAERKACRMRSSIGSTTTTKT